VTADLLLAAASRLRELANAATPGPWIASAGQVDGAGTVFSDGYALPNDLTFIAAMSPPVALALADWLDDVAVLAACDNCTTPLPRCEDAQTVRGKIACCPECAHARKALTLAALIVPDHAKVES